MDGYGEILALVAEIDLQQAEEAFCGPAFVLFLSGDRIARNAVPEIDGVGKLIVLVLGVAEKSLEKVDLRVLERMLGWNQVCACAFRWNAFFARPAHVSTLSACSPGAGLESA